MDETQFGPDAMERIEELITNEIPVTRHLEFSLMPGDENELIARAPLKANLNHMGSAFGGSLSMLSTLTGWAMVRLLLDEMKERAEIIIQESDIEYLRPVRDDIAVVCEPPDTTAVEQFHQMLDRWGKARLELKCKIHAAGERAVTFVGQYVALAEDALAERDR